MTADRTITTYRAMPLPAGSLAARSEGSSMTTPTPWDVRKDHLGSWWVIERDTQRRVCYVGHESDARAEGDARLIVDAVNARAAERLDSYMTRMVAAYTGGKGPAA
jgi:hypothetical protein